MNINYKIIGTHAAVQTSLLVLCGAFSLFVSLFDQYQGKGSHFCTFLYKNKARRTPTSDPPPAQPV